MALNCTVFNENKQTNQGGFIGGEQQKAKKISKNKKYLFKEKLKVKNALAGQIRWLPL
jgi:hypothetical protein